MIEDLRAAFPDAVQDGVSGEYLTDFSQMPGQTEAVVLPRDAEEVAAT